MGSRLCSPHFSTVACIMVGSNAKANPHMSLAKCKRNITVNANRLDKLSRLKEVMAGGVSHAGEGLVTSSDGSDLVTELRRSG